MPNDITATAQAISKTIQTGSLAYSRASYLKNLDNSLLNDTNLKQLMHSHLIYDRADIEWYTKFNRFGCMDPYNSLSTTREYLFFTKPDLHICEYKKGSLNPDLKSSNFFTELMNRYPQIISQLQKSSRIDSNNDIYPFMNLLSNSVQNSMDMPAVTSEMIETNKNIYGTSIDYRGDGYGSDEGYDFTLEFEDTKYLELYHLFKAYEGYERLKRHGLVAPPGNQKFTSYHKNMVLHDQFAIFKIIVGEDLTDIIYYAMAQGVVIKSVPRDSFSDLTNDSKLKYSVEFHANFVFDMEPWIIDLFNYNINECVSDLDSRIKNIIPIYDSSRHRINGEWVSYPVILRKDKDEKDLSWDKPDGMKYGYNLVWI